MPPSGGIPPSDPSGTSAPNPDDEAGEEFVPWRPEDGSAPGRERSGGTGGAEIPGPPGGTEEARGPDAAGAWHPESPEGWEQAVAAAKGAVPPPRGGVLTSPQLLRRSSRRGIFRRLRRRRRGSSRGSTASSGSRASSGSAVSGSPPTSRSADRGTSRSGGGRRSGRPRRSHRRRVALLAVLVLAGAFVVLLLASVVPALAVKQSLDAGRAALEGGQRSLLKARSSESRASFAQAQEAFQKAVDQANSPLLRAVGAIPFVGRNADAVAALARVGSDVATAGTDLAQGLARLPNGLASFAPAGGRIPVSNLELLAPAISRARARMEEADRLLGGIAHSLVLPQIGSARSLVQARVSSALGTLRPADALFGAIPELAGVDRPTTYLVNVMNPAELRGAGGVMGVYSTLTISDGALNLAPFQNLGSLDNVPPSQAPAPPAGYGPPYSDAFGGSGFWVNLNAHPDVPTVGSMIEALWQQQKGQALDGVIFVTPEALAELLKGMGPVKVKALDGFVVDGENAVDFITNKAFFQFEGGQKQRKQVMGLVAHEVLDRFFAARHPQNALRALVRAASAGYIQLHAADPNLQAAFREAGVAGDFGVPSGDFFSVVVNNVAGNKVDFYAERTVHYEVMLGPHGTATSTAAVALRNEAPSLPTRNEALGPFNPKGPGGPYLASGENLSFVELYCSISCDSTRAQVAGDDATLLDYDAGRLQLHATTIDLKSRQAKTLTAGFFTGSAWSGGDAGGEYHLRFQNQLTIKPTTVTIGIRPPAGMHLTSASAPLRIEGGEAVWTGVPGRSLDLRVTFSKGVLGRTWAQIWDFLRKPAIRLRSVGPAPPDSATFAVLSSVRTLP